MEDLKIIVMNYEHYFDENCKCPEYKYPESILVLKTSDGGYLMTARIKGSDKKTACKRLEKAILKSSLLNAEIRLDIILNTEEVVKSKLRKNGKVGKWDWIDINCELVGDKYKIQMTRTYEDICKRGDE